MQLEVKLNQFHVLLSFIGVTPKTRVPLILHCQDSNGTILFVFTPLPNFTISSAWILFSQLRCSPISCMELSLMVDPSLELQVFLQLGVKTEKLSFNDNDG